MFERFTDQSRRVVVVAQEEARRLDHNYIGTEHLLLGLLREDRGTAAKALESVNITLDAARREVEVLIGRGEKAPSGHIPFTRRAKKCLELSLREALQLGQNYIGTGHLLLALIRQGDSAAVQILGRLDADLDHLRARVTLELEDHPEDQGGGPPRARQVTPRQLEAFRNLLDTIDDRLTAIEQHLGIPPAELDELRRYDQRIAEVRREKEAAIDSQDFEKAAALRDKEKELLAERARTEKDLTASREPGNRGERGDDAERGDEGSAAGQASKTVASSGTGERPDELSQLQAEVARLRALLREHDIDPGELEDPSAAG
jgi:ATP-dependent Clp protease ATP-binding subunit ClpA